MQAINIEKEEVASVGTAFYRLPDDMFKFLQKCEADEEIIGFEWDGNRDFGVILGSKKVKEQLGGIIK